VEINNKGINKELKAENKFIIEGRTITVNRMKTDRKYEGNKERH
jgi:hypothetical protein